MTNQAFPEAWCRGLYEAIARRRDMQAFLPDPIPPTTLARILSAANQAGSVGLSQPWNFLVIENRDIRRHIQAHVEQERVRAAEGFTGTRREQYLAFKLEGILEAPINVCVTCDQERFGPAVIGRNTIPETAIYSTCCAVQNFWLAARAEGLGVGWVSILEPSALRTILRIPDQIIPVAYLCVGFVERFSDRPTRETTGWLPRIPLQDLVFHDRWAEQPESDLRRALETGPPDTDRGRADQRHDPPLIAGLPEAEHPSNGNPTRKGWLLVYTGQGKGKTTAALGLVFRALGRDLRVAVVQFIKGKWKTGERVFADTIPRLTFLVLGHGVTWDNDDRSQDQAAALDGWATAKKLIASGDYPVVVLDELTYPINHGVIPLAEVLTTCRARPAHVHVVITGRTAPEELCAIADLVTEMQAVKHPFTHGAKAQPGIDY